MSGDEQIDPRVSRSDFVHEQLSESPVNRWILLDGNQHTLTGIVPVVEFGTSALVGLAGYIPGTDPGTATTLVAALVGGPPVHHDRAGDQPPGALPGA